MFFTHFWTRGLLVIGLLIAAPVFAQTSNADNSPWQLCPSALADPTAPLPDKQWDLTLSPYAHHWRYSPEHRPVFLGALEQRVQGSRFCGLALFHNSFGQPSSYLYVGQQWDNLLGNPKLFAKVSAGLIWLQRRLPTQDPLQRLWHRARCDSFLRLPHLQRTQRASDGAGHSGAFVRLRAPLLNVRKSQVFSDT